MRKRVAVIGGGVSGLVCARLLATRHDVRLFEAADALGGHARTVEFEAYGRRLAADVGFIVFNQRTYPQFVRVLEALGVCSQPADMSFSVRDDASRLEYRSTGLGGLFAQRRNVVRPRHWRMLADIAKFFRDSERLLREADERMSLGELVRREGYGREFARDYLLPMTAAIWSAPPARVEEFPAAFLLRFFQNHGLLQLANRPPWLTIVGGSRRYVSALAAPLRDCVTLGAQIDCVRRIGGGVVVEFSGGAAERFDAVVLATHGPTALALFADATPQEREILSAFRVQSNDAVLHTDASLLPRRRAAWASWNYLVSGDDERPPVLTYDLNRLQRLGAPGPVCLTLNPVTPPREESVVAQFRFDHPMYSAAAVAAQGRRGELHRDGRVFFCGAYWGNGFHEDGVDSALAVCRQFGISLDDWEPCKAVCTEAA